MQPATAAPLIGSPDTRGSGVAGNGSSGPAALLIHAGPYGLPAPSALRTSCEVSRRVGTVRGDCSCAAAAAWASAAAVVTARWGRCHAPHGSGVRHAAAGARPLLLAAAQERSRAAAAARRQASGGALAIAISAPIAGDWWCTSSGKRWPGWQCAVGASLSADWALQKRQELVMHVQPAAMRPLGPPRLHGSGIGLVVGAPSQGRRLPCPHSDHRSAWPPCRRPPSLTTLHDNPLFSQLPPRPQQPRTACAAHLGGRERVRGGAALTVPRRRLWQAARWRSGAPERGAEDLRPHSGTRQTDGRALEAAGRANPGVGLCPAAVERLPVSPALAGTGGSTAAAGCSTLQGAALAAGLLQGRAPRCPQPPTARLLCTHLVQQGGRTF